MCVKSTALAVFYGQESAGRTAHCMWCVSGWKRRFSIPAVQDLHFSHELVHWSGKMERAMERIQEWHSYGQMEASSANYSWVQLIPMVTHMKGRALWSSSCPSLYPSFYMEMFSIFLSFPPRNGVLIWWDFWGGLWKNRTWPSFLVGWCKDLWVPQYLNRRLFPIILDAARDLTLD